MPKNIYVTDEGNPEHTEAPVPAEGNSAKRVGRDAFVAQLNDPRACARAEEAHLDAIRANDEAGGPVVDDNGNRLVGRAAFVARIQRGPAPPKT